MTQSRRHDLDGLRFLAIFILLFFHTAMWFNTFGWHVKNSELSAAFDYPMAWSHFWRMPLLLFISGAGTYLALGKRTPGKFAAERIRRLFVPLVVGMLAIVPPQIYFEYIDRYNGYWDFYKTVFEFKRYPYGSFSWHHLWFIAYLLVYSLLAIPLLAYLRSTRSTGLKARLSARLGSPFAMLAIPSVLICLSQVLLRPYFPDETHNLTHDWAYFTFYGCFFLFGMLFYATPRLWDAVRQNRRHLLVAALLSLFPFFGGMLHMREVVRLPFSLRAGEIIFDVSATFLGWFTVIAIIGYGQQYLNRPRPWLRPVNEGLYPFYILHQTVIIWIGYYICQLDWGIAAKFWSISLLTLVACVGFYLLCIRPFNGMRFLFGMKPKSRTATNVNDTAIERTAFVARPFCTGWSSKLMNKVKRW